MHCHQCANISVTFTNEGNFDICFFLHDDFMHVFLFKINKICFVFFRRENIEQTIKLGRNGKKTTLTFIVQSRVLSAMCGTREQDFIC